MSPEPAPLSEDELNKRLDDGDADNRPLHTTLRTDQRVLARVTDGIYRQPASALRELISNAYDADATRVTIRTERPEFLRMSIDDDGIGMSSRALVRMLHHIGGSAKRTEYGANFGITSPDNPNMSRGGRPLIGKIGIGLFSVAQLTQAFQIVTKVAGLEYQTVADVVLRQYSDDVVLGDKDTYEAGIVRIWKEPASDIERQGTSITLTAIRPQTRETLRSIRRWQSVFAQEDAVTKRLRPPRFHVGIVDDVRPEHFRHIGSDLVRLPWREGAEGIEAMREMVLSIVGAVQEGSPNPSVRELFDTYLEMLWDLSLAPPLPYVGSHPFDLRAQDGVRAYLVSSSSKESLRPLDLGQGSIRQAAGLGATVTAPDDFSVDIDNVQLLRPVRFTGSPLTSAALTESLIFVGRHRETFRGVDSAMSGGPLEFQAYFFVAPKIVPVEQRGVKIRVNDASGIPYDGTFLGFPVAELRRLSQITCEIFVTEGFDGALNIDRESFNYSHSHVRVLTRWLHSTLRKVIGEQKRLGTQAMRERRRSRSDEAFSKMEDVVERVWSERGEIAQAEPPAVLIGPRSGVRQVPAGTYTLDESVIGEITGPNSREREEAARELVSSIAKVLAAFDLLDRLDQREREDLLSAIREIVQATKI